MKTTKYIVAAFSLILGLSSCYDLDVAPYDKVAQGNYWKTEADAKSGVMGVYARHILDNRIGTLNTIICILPVLHKKIIGTVISPLLNRAARPLSNIRISIK